MVGDVWGVDLMYYDLGASSLKDLDIGDNFVIDSNNYAVTTAGSITNDISGFGTGLILASDNTSGYASFHTYIKSWRSCLGSIW